MPSIACPSRYLRRCSSMHLICTSATVAARRQLPMGQKIRKKKKLTVLEKSMSDEQPGTGKFAEPACESCAQRAQTAFHQPLYFFPFFFSFFFSTQWWWAACDTSRTRNTPPRITPTPVCRSRAWWPVRRVAFPFFFFFFFVFLFATDARADRVQASSRWRKSSWTIPEPPRPRLCCTTRRTPTSLTPARTSRPSRRTTTSSSLDD